MKTKIDRAAEIHRSMTPHQMALRIVELQDALELAEEVVRAVVRAKSVRAKSVADASYLDGDPR